MKLTFPFACLSALVLSWAIVACDTPDPDTSFDPVLTGTFGLTFDNVVSSEDLRLNSSTYRNASGESFTPTTFNYFISNIKLTRTDGSTYVVPQDSSYFLIQESQPASQKIQLRNVPIGSYRAVTFLIGVDSLRSTMDIGRRTGVLDPAGDHTGANGMYWSWNSGYIFMKLEGTSPAAPADAAGQRTFRYHIGFFGGRDTRTINNLKTVTLPFGSDAVEVAANRMPEVTLQTDVLKIFDGPVPLSIAKSPEIMVSPSSKDVADNYANMVRYKNVVTTAVN